MGPLQKISSYFGPIMAVIPTVLVHLVLVNHPYISRTSCQTSLTSRDVNCFDQWYCPGVGNRRCDWLMKLPQWKKSQRSLLAREAKQVCWCCCAQCEIKKRLIFTLFDNFAKKNFFRTCSQDDGTKSKRNEQLAIGYECVAATSHYKFCDTSTRCRERTKVYFCIHICCRIMLCKY